jgi:hypothetical protein
MTKSSEAYQRAWSIAPVLVCLVCCLGSGGCTAKHAAAAPPHFQADFNVAPTSDGQHIVWWLRMSGPQFTAMVHQAAREPHRGSVDDLMHKDINMLILAGLVQHGILWCDTSRRTVAVLKGGAMQWTGYCVPYAPVPASEQSEGGGT